MQIGYARCSTGQQDHALQLDALRHIPGGRGAVITEIGSAVTA